MGKKRILLVTPPYHCGMLEAAGTWLPLGLVYLAGAVREAGHEVIIYDAMSLYHGWEEIACLIEDFKPHILASGAITATVNDSLKLCHLAKEIDPQVITVLGNVHPTFMYEEVLASGVVDFIVRGEGEETFSELVECLAAEDNPQKVAGLAFLKDGGPFLTPERPFVVDLDRLKPAWDLLDWSVYTYHPQPGSRLAIVSSSRGCVAGCLFCSQRLFWRGSWRARSPEAFVDELAYLRRVYGVDVVMISDEYPTRDRQRWQRILDLLLQRDLEIEILMETRVDDIIRDEDIMEKYRLAGITHIYVGVESPDQQKIDLFQKDIRVEASKKALDIINRADIVSETSFVVGTPDETKDSLNQTLELAKFYDPDMAFFLPLTPWPYTPLYQRFRDYIEDYNYSHYNLIEPIIRPLAMSRAELRRAMFSATGRFFAHKFARLETLTPYKRGFMLTVLQLLLERSYLASEMMSLLVPFKRFLKGNAS
ncbi:radical SAM protein [Thermosulfuriphilus ammonigenes]|uniref:Radical SAM protein n=1 Tax=Thermosulfuriphilus ammonigenes TaxID=1936021 RepID=A0A6G7PVS4_9BACT|nr:cobalamin-dependent protein [Thermosulfuriphilus ammonigenes]MBA2848100.1 anaerobic magnesium-protoporphyrin IX monomethyl ester cyclase [Thermosulfuriphilus ammonigenes]QIJ71720.1 radical SAM protein [Thermosulfuriphilus ammonigenes]